MFLINAHPGSLNGKMAESALRTLLCYSLAMIIVPVGGFFASKTFLFEGVLES